MYHGLRAIGALWCAAVCIPQTADADVTLHVDVATASASVSKVRDTLENLLKSIEDDGNDAEDVSNERQSWCQSTLRDSESASHMLGTSLADMRGELTETEAQVEEGEGTSQQIQADIEMVQRTLAQTEAMMKMRGLHEADTSASALLDNKQENLRTLQGELGMASSVLSQHKASAAEIRQRISERSETVKVADDFVSAVRAGCRASENREGAQATARQNESQSIRAVLQALDATAASDLAPEDVPRVHSSSPSFVQFSAHSQDMTAEDLSEIFAPHQHNAAPAHWRLPLNEHAKTVKTASSLKLRIGTLLTQLESRAPATMDRKAWCSAQRKSSELALKLAHDSVAQTTSELDAHAAQDVEISEELRKLHGVAAGLADSVQKAEDQATREAARIRKRRSDQELAAKIVRQALTILTELGMASTSKAVTGLDAAGARLEAQARDAGLGGEVSAEAKAFVQAADKLSRALESEKRGLDFAREDHTSQRLRCAEDKRLAEASSAEAFVFLKKLAGICTSGMARDAQQQRSAQTRALADADKALEGKLIEAKSSNLRKTAPKASSTILTPIQRAAVEMGMSLD